MVDQGGTASLGLFSVLGKENAGIVACADCLVSFGASSRGILSCCLVAKLLSVSVRPMWMAEDRFMDLDRGPCMCGLTEATPTRKLLVSNVVVSKTIVSALSRVDDDSGGCQSGVKCKRQRRQTRIDNNDGDVASKIVLCPSGVLWIVVCTGHR